MLARVPVHRLTREEQLKICNCKVVPFFGEYGGCDCQITNTQPSIFDGMLIGAALEVLTSNLDLVEWATCLVQRWSPETSGSDMVDDLDMVEGVLDLMSPGEDGAFRFSVTYVDVNGTVGANMWAFTEVKPRADGGVGLIVPIDSSATRWASWVTEWRAGSGSAFCAAVQVASTILHEFVHIVGDGFDNGWADPHSYRNVPGTLHEGSDVLFPCWDEPRMIATIFLWAMSQRYPCLVTEERCRCMGEPLYFALSSNQSEQLRGLCR